MLSSNKDLLTYWLRSACSDSAYCNTLHKVTSASSHRPISNLSVCLKLVERLVAHQLMEYLSLTDLLPPLQSGFWEGHSTKTPVCRYFPGCRSRWPSCSGPSDLSAAFDTVNHSSLLECLQQTCYWRHSFPLVSVTPVIQETVHTSRSQHVSGHIPRLWHATRIYPGRTCMPTIHRFMDSVNWPR